MKTFPCFALRIILLCGTVLLLHFNASADIVDTTFNASIETATYLPKSVEKLIPLPDGKTIAAGNFSNYNGQKVGGLIRLNADGSLDATFKNDLLKLTPQQIVVYPNGKVLLLGNFTFFDGTEYFRKILRLNADGAIDTSFTSAASGPVVSAAIDASGRAWVAGNLQVIINGAPENRILIRINDDG